MFCSGLGTRAERTTIWQEQCLLVVTQQLGPHGKLLTRAVDVAPLSEQVVGNLFRPHDHIHLAKRLVLIDRAVFSSPFCELEPEVASSTFAEIVRTADEWYAWKRASGQLLARE